MCYEVIITLSKIASKLAPARCTDFGFEWIRSGGIRLSIGLRIKHGAQQQTLSCA